MLKLLHTADLHLGWSFGPLDSDDQRKLARARLSVVETILRLAEQYEVDAVLWAGDIFDSPDPEEDWWKGFARSLRSCEGWTRPIVLLPGNHDPLKDGSVYHSGHPFRQLLPSCVHIVDQENFELEIGTNAVVYASPCRSTAGADDLASALPPRPEADRRIRVGMVHGSTFDIPGYQTNFPIGQDAAEKCGLDYLAVGDTHGFRIVKGGRVCPIVYPGAPEPTGFKETGAGSVAMVTITATGSTPRVLPLSVGRWTWREETVRSIEELRLLASEDLSSTVLRLYLDMQVSPAEEAEVDGLTNLLKGTLATSGRAGALVLDRRKLQLTVGPVEDVMRDAPESLRSVADRLAQDPSDEAQRALRILYRLVSEGAT